MNTSRTIRKLVVVHFSSERLFLQKNLLSEQKSYLDYLILMANSQRVSVEVIMMDLVLYLDCLALPKRLYSTHKKALLSSRLQEKQRNLLLLSSWQQEAPSLDLKKHSLHLVLDILVLLNLILMVMLKNLVPLLHILELVPSSPSLVEMNRPLLIFQAKLFDLLLRALPSSRELEIMLEKDPSSLVVMKQPQPSVLDILVLFNLTLMVMVLNLVPSHLTLLKDRCSDSLALQNR